MIRYGFNTIMEIEEADRLALMACKTHLV